MNAMSLPVNSRHLKVAIARGNKFVKAHPLVAKAVPTAIGFAFGDFLTQYMNRDKSVPFEMKLEKTVKMMGVGACIAGPLGLLAIQSMSRSVPLAAAILAAEVFGCIIWQAAYISICPKYREGAHRLATSVQSSLKQLPATSRSRRADPVAATL